MSSTLLTGSQTNPWNAFFIIMVFLTFHSLELTQAATEKTLPTKASAFEMTFTGTGPTKTQRFTVNDGWKIQWETESPTFKLSAHGSARRPYNGPTNEREEILRWFEVLEPIILANSTKHQGKAVHPLGGTFYLKIVATGPWRVHLKTFKDTKDYLDVPYTGAP